MDRPNILFLLADDLGWGDVSLHGSPIRTPVIDRLAHEGVELTQHYVYPMCTPTRAALLTGRHPSRFGPYATVASNAPVLPDGYPTLATVLRDGGYDTALFGKWHLGSAPRFAPNHYGFNTAYGSLAGGVDPYNHRYKRGPFSVTWHHDGQPVQEQGHVTDLIVDRARQWVESRDRPWFCYVAFTAVHIPVKPTPEWLSRYADERLDDDPLKDASFKKYAAYTSHMDWGIGQLLESLRRTGQRERTLIVLASDNGAINACPLHSTEKYPGVQEAYPLLGSNAPYRGVKAQLYEGGIRTPTVVNWLGRVAPGKIDPPVQVVDWMPTLTAVAAVAPATDPHWDGQDIWPVIAGESPPTDRRLFWNFHGGDAMALRHGDWKLIVQRTDTGPRRELFHIAQDPYERCDLAAQCPREIEDLTDMLQQEQRLDNASARGDVDSPMVS